MSQVVREMCIRGRAECMSSKSTKVKVFREAVDAHMSRKGFEDQTVEKRIKEEEEGVSLGKLRAAQHNTSSWISLFFLHFRMTNE